MGRKNPNAYRCLRSRGWVGLKKPKFLRIRTLKWVGGFEMFKYLLTPAIVLGVVKALTLKRVNSEPENRATLNFSVKIYRISL